MTRTLRTLLASALLAAAVPTVFAEDAKPAGEPAKAAESASEPAQQPQPEGYHFALTGPGNQAVTDASEPFKDKYLLVAFGFTSCPDVCPTTLYEFGEMLKKVKEPDVIQPVFISIDPLRDNSKVLNQYTNYFSPRIIGLTGDMPTIEATAKRFNATFGYRFQGKKVTPPDLPEGYTVYHSTMIYLLSPKREMIDVFDYQSGADKLARDIEKAIAKDRGDKA